MQAMDFDTGARLKEERERRRLSQRQLAAATGVTSGMISMIEQNRTSPSVATLKKILAGLDISLGDFFAGAAVQMILLGARLAHHDRVDDLEM